VLKQSEPLMLAGVIELPALELDFAGGYGRRKQQMICAS